jgi:hypothetical protein
MRRTVLTTAAYDLSELALKVSIRCCAKVVAVVRKPNI